MSTELLLLLIAAGVLVIVVVLVRRARRVNRRRAAARDTANRMAQPRDPFASDNIGGDPEKIKLGDLLSWPGVSGTFAVRGTARLVEGRYRWTEHFIDPGAHGEQRYLSVERVKGNVVLVAWTEVRNPGLRPGADEVAFKGTIYTLEEDGTANYTTEGTTDLPDTSGQIRYYDYRGPHGQRLSFERYESGGKWELSTGETILDSQLTIYPSS
jgi:hypothetical protein